MINKKTLLITFFLTVFILGWIFFFISFFGSDYKIILDGEEVKEFIKCDTEWNYKNRTFIPCVWNNTIEAIPGSHINWSLSPQENCNHWNGTFPGFNVKNQTEAKRQYDELMPKCNLIKDKDIGEGFLLNCKCVDGYGTIIEKENETFWEQCSRYKCSENLEIIK